MRKIIIFFLIIAPIIDYTYKIKYPFIGELELSPNRIFKLIPIVLLIFWFFMNNKKVFLWKYALYIVLIFPIVGVCFGLLSFPVETIDVYIRFLSSFVFLFLAGKLLKEQDIIKVFRLLTLVTLIPIVIAYLQFFQIVPYTDFDTIGGIQLGRVSGGYEKQVAMMSYLIYGFSFALFSLLNSKTIVPRIYYFIYIVFTIGVVIASTHRVSMIIFTLILSYFFYEYKKNYLFFLILPLIIFFIFEYQDLLKLIFIESGGIGQDKGQFFRGRVGFWEDYINNLLNSGIIYILFGKGNAVLDSEGEYLPYMWNEPHSDFIRIIYQYGIIGVIAFIFCILTIIKRSIDFKKRASDIMEKFIGNIGIIIGLSLLLYSITLEPTRYPSFWWYYSAVASYILVNQRENYKYITK